MRRILDVLLPLINIDIIYSLGLDAAWKKNQATSFSPL